MHALATTLLERESLSGEEIDQIIQEGAVCMSRSPNGARRRFVLRCRGGDLQLGERTLVMGVLNCTPDSFSDGGLFRDPAEAIEHGLRMAEEGADIIDVGRRIFPAGL